MRKGSEMAERQGGIGVLGSGYALVALAGILLSQLPALVPATELADLKLIDLGFAALRAWSPPAAPLDPEHDIVIVGIDEATVDALPEPMSLWHAHLGSALSGIAQARPRLLAVDIALPQHSFDFLRPGLDAALLSGLYAARKAAPLVVALAVDETHRVLPVYAPFLAVAGESAGGLTQWPLDPDHVLRRFDEALGDGGQKVETFAGNIGRTLGGKVEPGLVNFAVGRPYGYIPLRELLAWRAAGDTQSLTRAFAGKIVFVGSVLRFVDRHPQPVNLASWEPHESSQPGVLLNAQAVRTFLSGGTIQRLPTGWLAGLALLPALLWFVGRRLAAALALVAAAVALGLFGLFALKSGWHVPIAALLGTAAIATMARNAYEAWVNLRERRRLRAVFAGYVSPAVLNAILNGDIASGPGERRANLSFLFVDIRGFTALSEHLAAERVFGLLNRYYESMIEAVHRYQGTIDNFRGDGMMVVFGAPNSLAEPRRNAVLSVAAMLERLAVLNRQLAEEGEAELAIGIGISSGAAMVGNIGSRERHDFTAIGDAVNVAAKLQDRCKDLGHRVLMSAEFGAIAAECGIVTPLGRVPIPGHSAVDAIAWAPAAASEATAKS